MMLTIIEYVQSDLNIKITKKQQYIRSFRVKAKPTQEEIDEFIIEETKYQNPKMLYKILRTKLLLQGIPKMIGPPF